ncbi:MAG: hypothetical protein ABEI52_09150, partial [Halobacteriaceae archaeon]
RPVNDHQGRLNERPKVQGTSKMSGDDSSKIGVPEVGKQLVISTSGTGDLLTMLPEDAFNNLLLISVRHPRIVQRKIENIGASPETIGIIPVNGSDIEYDGKCWCARRVSPSDLTGIDIESERGLRHVNPGGWMAVDNITTLLMYGNEDAVYHLCQSLLNRARDADATGVYAMSRRAVGDETFARFQGLFDGVVTVSSNSR